MLQLFWCVSPKTRSSHFKSKPGFSRGGKETRKSARFVKAALEINPSKGKLWQVALQLVASV